MKKRKRWTKEEDSKLVELSKKGLSLREIAEKMPGRTKGAVSSRRAVLRGPVKESDIWTKEKHKQLVELSKSYTVTKISELLNIRRSAVYTRMKQFKLLEYNDPLYNPWTPEEDTHIKERYLLESYPRIAERLGRSTSSVKQRARGLGLRKANSSLWTEKEVNYLELNYENSTTEELVKNLNRTASAIYTKANSLNLGEVGSNLKKEEELFIIANSNIKTDNEIARLLNCSLDKVAEIRKKNNLFKFGNEVNGESYIEKKVSEILDKLNVEYLHNQPLGKYRPDFQFVGSNKIIEVHGDYWHCNPHVYPEGPKDDVQIKGVLQDYYKKCFYVSSGYDVLYIWESEIKESLNKVKQKISSFILPSL